MISFDIHNKFKFSIIGKQNSELEKYLNDELGYFKSEVTSPDMEIELVDKIPEGKTPLFPLYSKDDASFYLKDSYGNKITILYETSNVRLTAESKINGNFLLYVIIEPLMFYNLLGKGFTFLHASAVSKDDKALMFCAWPHTGKTNTVLSLILRNYSFLADESSLISRKGYVYPYPRPISAFYYNLEEFPELIDVISKSLIDKQKIRLRTFFAKMQNRMARGHSRKFILNAINYGLNRISQPSKGSKIDPNDLTDIGNISKIEKLFLLQTDTVSSEVHVEEIENMKGLSTALSASWIWEREIFTTHYLAYLFAFPERNNQALENSLKLHSEIIRDALKNTECFKVIIPQKLPFKKSFQMLQGYL